MQVTVLVPAYNAERYLSEALESVLCQTHEGFELLIIDDGSTDDTLSIACSYARKDSRIEVLSNSDNLGVVATRNLGLERASNEWVVCMDADDIMLPERIERQIAFVEQNPDVVVASTYSYYIDEEGRVIGRYRSPFISRTRVEGRVSRNELVAFHANVIMRKSVVMEAGGFRPQAWLVEDLDMWNRIAEHGHTVLVQPEYLYKYRKYATSSSSANTRLTWLRIRWLEACILSHRAGEGEPSWEEFLDRQRRVPLQRRLNQERKDLARVLYGVAVSRFSRREYYLFALSLVAAALLEPGFILPRVAQRVLYSPPAEPGVRK